MKKNKGICFDDDGKITRKFKVSLWIADDESGRNFCFVYTSTKRDEHFQILVPVRDMIAMLRKGGYIQ